MKLVPDPTRTGSARLDSPWSEPPRTCDCRPRTLPFTITFSIALLASSQPRNEARLPLLTSLRELRKLAVLASSFPFPISLWKYYRVSIFTFSDETPCEISTCPTCQGCSRCGCISAGPTSTVNRLPRSFSSIVSPPSDKLCPFARETTSPSDLCPPIPSFRLDNSATRSRRSFAPPVPTLSPSLFLNIWGGRGGGEGKIVYRSRRITIKENLLDRSPIVIVVVRVSVSSPLSFIHR